jgi:hypothetical protein
MKGSQSRIKRGENRQGSETPALECIQQRAYFKFLERGGTPGRELEDWCEAEREMREQQSQWSDQRISKSNR